MPDLCKHCGKPESEHHQFEAGEPSACVCSMALDAKPRPICREFRRGKTVQWCLHCAHDEACHKGKD